MRRMGIAVLSIALLSIFWSAGVFAQAFPEIIGDPIELGEERFMDWIQNEEITYSPDGNWYAYYTNSATYLVPVNGGETILFMDYGSDTVGNDEDDIIIDGYRSTGARYGLDFSPDGTELVAGVVIYDTSKGSSFEEGDDGSRSGSRGIRSIVTVDIATGEITYIADGQNPRWTTDGRYILYNNYDYRMWADPENAEHIYELTKYDTVTGEKEFIEPLPYEDRIQRAKVFDVGPDNKIYFARFVIDEEEGSSDFKIERVPVSGGDVEEITPFYEDGVCTHLQVSSDGKWVLFTDNEDVLLADIATGNIFNVFTHELQTELRSNSFSEIGQMRLFQDPYFFNNESQIVYDTLTVDGFAGGYSTSSGMNPEEQAFDGRYVMDFDPANYVALGEDIISAVDELPQQFMTLGAFPNPFNPTTTLQFTLPEAGYAELEVFSFTGQKVRTLAAGQYSAGVHSIGWDGRDEQGNPVSSGIYLSRLTSSNNVVTSRMTLVK